MSRSNFWKFSRRLKSGTVGKLFSSQTDIECLGSIVSWSWGFGMFLNDASRSSATFDWPPLHYWLVRSGILTKSSTYFDVDPFKFWLTDSNELTFYSMTVEGLPRPLNIPPENFGIILVAPVLSSSTGSSKLPRKLRLKLALKAGASIYRLFEFTGGSEPRWNSFSNGLLSGFYLFKLFF